MFLLFLRKMLENSLETCEPEFVLSAVQGADPGTAGVQDLSMVLH